MLRRIEKKEICNDSGIKLDSEREAIFKKNVEGILCANTIPIYRGDSRVSQMFNVEQGNLHSLSDAIFTIGAKSRLFTKNIEHSEVLDVNSTSLSDFLWNGFYNVVENGALKESNKGKALANFLKNNKEFCDFFANPRNRPLFVSVIERLSFNERIKVQDYYYALLQTLGINVFGYNYFCSATTNYFVAKNMAGKKGIIIYGWVPEHGDSYIKYEIINDLNQTIVDIGLPVYTTPVFKNQREICLKCGFLPHFIFGFQKANKFIVNPAMLNSMNFEHVANEGLSIDQTHFNNILRSSKYKYQFFFCDGYYYEID